MQHPHYRAILDHPITAEISAALRAHKTKPSKPTPHRILAKGSVGSAHTFIAAALAHKLRSTVLLVLAHLDDADEAADELNTITAHEVIRLPALETLPGDSSIGLDLFAERLSALRRIEHPQHTDVPRVIIAPIHALMQAAPKDEDTTKLVRTLQKNTRLDPTELTAWLAESGYERTDAVEEPGQFAVRGGIIDIFPPGAGTTNSTAGSPPVRLDFFGDELERIAEIDPDTMGSDRTIDAVEIVCAEPKHAQQALDRGRCPVELLPTNTTVILHELIEITEQARGYYERVTDSRGVFGPPAVMRHIEQQLTPNSKSDQPGAIIELSHFAGTPLPGTQELNIPVGALPPFNADASAAVAELAEIARAGVNVIVCCQNGGELQRFGELATEFAPNELDHLPSVLAYVHRGYVWGANETTTTDDNSNNNSKHKPRPLAVVPYHELVHRFETRRGVRRIRSARALDTFLTFEPGDIVVHRDHGLAKFIGLKRMAPSSTSSKKRAAEPPTMPDIKPLRGAKGKQANSKKPTNNTPAPTIPEATLEEFLELEFAGKAKLFLPAVQIDLVQKYVGGKGTPTLSTLGGARWSKQKEAVADSVRDLAGELLRVRAARESQPGLRFPDDTPWQREFEASFPFQETDDQLAAVSEIKRDMSSPRPMDRLICGDVGFGKTELAIRAAFKAAEFGKQVAVLVPTTVLAEQHERTFKGRLAGYPFRIESLSRFKTDKEVNDVLASVRKGQVDIVIGTHRLLSKDVRFADLGLVVVDEEQKFGVEHKERLLRLRLTADVLTLSATPIPRTLHMSMMGLRDISSLTTAPMDRRAVVTEVIPYNPIRIKQAIERELAREGQIFFVHNRVHNINSVADDIYKLVPNARIIVGHGQMPDGQLEKVMLAFTRREADILVSTTIIESGIDIPTANTMFINDADRFGLADLHQLRGRVGRYKHRAYCYLLTPTDRPLAEKSKQRLQAIQEYAMLGAGFKIAMRDLEIRGAGNILGPEQSGHIAAVGYDMYCQLLNHAVKDLRNESTTTPSETTIDLGVRVTIPKPYIPSDARRMDAYRRAALATTASELEKVRKELTDAYGEPPPIVQQLLDIAELRIAASKLGVRAIVIRRPDVVFRVDPDRRRELAETLAPLAGNVVALNPKPNEEAAEVYYRPPGPQYLEPGTLPGLLRRRLSAGTEPRTQHPATSR